MSILMGIVMGFGVWFVFRYILTSFFTVDQNERAVKTVFGRAERLGDNMTINSPLADMLTDEHKKRYNYPIVKVIQPGGPYFKWPWEKIYKVSVATQTINMAYDPDEPKANSGGTILEAVTKDQLNTGLTGQIRYRVAENNLYAYLFGVKQPISHVMGYFVSVLRERIASFEAPPAPINNPPWILPGGSRAGSINYPSFLPKPPVPFMRFPLYSPAMTVGAKGGLQP